MKDKIRHKTRAGNISQVVSMKKHHKIRNPFLIQNCLCKIYATDTFFSKSATFEKYNCSKVSLGSTRHIELDVVLRLIIMVHNPCLNFSDMNLSWFLWSVTVIKCIQERRGITKWENYGSKTGSLKLIMKMKILLKETGVYGKIIWQS